MQAIFNKKPDTATFQYSDDKIEVLLKGIYDGSITEYDIPESLYRAIGEYLQKGLFEGFGATLEDVAAKDLELLTELHENIWMFSAAKSFQELKDIRSLLFDDEGNVVSASKFNELGAEAFSTWNEDYGRAEYVTAIGQAQMAVKWQDIVAKKDILPILVFDTKGNPCPECAPFEGFAAPVDDRIWNWLMPLLHFNCACTVRQEQEAYGVSSKESYAEVEELQDTVSPVFQMNAGKDQLIFNRDHPYFEVAAKDKDFAKENFGLPIPEQTKKAS